MAYRLATEYTKSRLELSEQEIRHVCTLFEAHEIAVEYRADDVGWCEVRAQKEQEVVLLRFSKQNERFLFEGDFRIRQKDLVNVMREIVSTFKGHAIVNRIYQHFTISYHYEHGTVVRIVESSDQTQQMIFERKHQNGEVLPFATATATQDRLQVMYQCNDVEQRIADLRAKVDQWLDIRNRMAHSMVPDQLQAIDRQLLELSRQLLSCEAI